MSLSPAETQQLKNVLGYGNLTQLALPYVDVALMFETVVQNNLDKVGEDLIRGYLGQITQVETDIYNARTKYVVNEISGPTTKIKLDPNQHERLVGLREWLVDRCSETSKVPRAPKMSRTSMSEVY